MCGIAGIYNYNKKKQSPISYLEIKKMLDAIKHRGPDGEGILTDDNIALGQQRLAISDLSEKGRQPMCNEDGSIWIVCNGEIYNCDKLRENLKKNGHEFKSKSDNEAIIHLYEEYHDEFVKKLNGMFALAIWDSKRQKLLLARDRLGIKPLYYYINDRKIIFASEIKSIFTHSWFKKEIDFEALHYYFFCNQIPLPKVIFKNINSVLPAELLIISPTQPYLQKKRYWQLIFTEDNNKNEEIICGELLELLENSARSHIIGDVPLGVALSGGIDSSMLVALLSRYVRNLKTFTFYFENDEMVKQVDFETANNVARIFKTQHRNIVLKHQNFIQDLDKIVEALDMPVNTFAFSYYLCQAAAQEVKVIFTGDGTEELFGKYWNHLLAQSMAFILSYIDNKKHYITLEEEFIKKYSKIICERAWHFPYLNNFKENDKRRLYSDFLYQKILKYNVYNFLIFCFKKTTAKNFFNKALEIDTNNFLVNHTLTILDRLSMINSVEIRPIFLDHHIVEYIASLPAKLKLRQGVIKYILKQMAEKIIPENIVNKFQPLGGVTGPPVKEWLLFYLEKYTKHVLSPRRLKRHEFFNKDYVNLLVKEHYYYGNKHKISENIHSQNNHTIKIWKLLIFQLWWEKYFD